MWNWNRKELKANGRKAIRANYWRCVIVSVLILAFAGGFTFARSGNTADALDALNYRGETHTEIVNDVVNNVLDQHEIFWAAFEKVDKADRADTGALASIFNNATASGSFLFGLLNALNQLIFEDSIMPGIILALGAGLVFLYYVFVENILQVGKYRFYLENRRYTETNVQRILYLYKIRCMKKVALVMFLRALYTVLWFFTIVGGFIKLYSYRMVPMIVAENPDIPAREAIRLSRAMMVGYKWKCFVLDLTFVGWRFLSWITFQLVGVFYLNPYYAATNAEIYMRLRQKAMAESMEGARYFNDVMLDGKDGGAQAAEYPVEKFTIPEEDRLRWLSTDYHRSYPFTHLVLLFFSFCFIGYVWEVVYYLVTTGTFINRGTMYGPWLPIYGCGGVLVLVLLRRFVDKPVLLFFLVMAVCGTVEYFTSWFLEVFKDTKWWDYTGYFLNINGRVCLEGLLVFGFAGTLGIYLLAPMLDDQISRMPKKVRIALCVFLAACFLTDLAYSAVHPNMAAGVAA